MASVTLVCYAIQHVHERPSEIARMPPRIGHCNQLFLHSSIEVGRACVERFRYGPRGMNERKRRVETAIVFLRPANWRGNATLTLFADRL